jgi:hypothetical protein
MGRSGPPELGTEERIEIWQPTLSRDQKNTPAKLRQDSQNLANREANGLPIKRTKITPKDSVNYITSR